MACWSPCRGMLTLAIRGSNGCTRSGQILDGQEEQAPMGMVEAEDDTGICSWSAPGILSFVSSVTLGRGGEASHHAAQLPTPPRTLRLSAGAGG